MDTRQSSAALGQLHWNACWTDEGRPVRANADPGLGNVFRLHWTWAWTWLVMDGVESEPAAGMEPARPRRLGGVPTLRPVR